ncbi:cupin domain-containing protein [Candidatus Acetothermia bacterium]|nr:cupin domain-containing protein [Candidatus Acetothermia bacterium]
MIEVRRFCPENKTPIPLADLTGLNGVVIQLFTSLANKLSPKELANVALYFDAHSRMHELHPILFLVINGNGFVRVGGPQAEILKVSAGDAVLWPAKVLHKAWTNGEPMQAIAIEYLNPAQA